MEPVAVKLTRNLQRQSFLGPKSDDVLLHTKVGIIGLGGGGSHVAQQLAHLGVGTFILVDPDQIEDTNLNRLIGGTADDVAKTSFKVDIAARLIQGIRPDSLIRAFPTAWITQIALLQTCDVVFACVDSMIGRNEIEAFTRRFLIPLIDVGMDVHALDSGLVMSGQVAVSLPDRPCLRCMGLISEAEMTVEANLYGKAGGQPQVVWPNGVLASTAVGFLVHIISPWHDSSELPILLEYDGNAQTLVPSSKLAYLPSVCKHYNDIGTLGDPFWQPIALETDGPSHTKTSPPDRPTAVISTATKRPFWRRWLRM